VPLFDVVRVTDKLADALDVYFWRPARNSDLADISRVQVPPLLFIEVVDLYLLFSQKISPLSFQTLEPAPGLVNGVMRLRALLPPQLFLVRSP